MKTSSRNRVLAGRWAAQDLKYSFEANLEYHDKNGKEEKQMIEAW